MNRISCVTNKKEGEKDMKKVLAIIAMMVLIVATAVSPASAARHGGGRGRRPAPRVSPVIECPVLECPVGGYENCPIEGECPFPDCTEVGPHEHDGVYYCDNYEEMGYNRGNWPGRGGMPNWGHQGGRNGGPGRGRR